MVIKFLLSLNNKTTISKEFIQNKKNKISCIETDMQNKLFVFLVYLLFELVLEKFFIVVDIHTTNCSQRTNWS